MRIVNIFLVCFLVQGIAYGQEFIEKFDESNVPALNESLREHENDIELLKNWYSQKAATTLYISGGIVTANHSVHAIDTEAAGASDDVSQILGGPDGAILTVYAANSARTVVLKDGTGNLLLSGDFSLTHVDDVCILAKSGSNWLEIACSDNTA